MGTSPAPTRRGLRRSWVWTRRPTGGDQRPLRRNALSAAHELLEDASLTERVDRLPFRPGETVLSVDDSFTDDLQSWLETTRCVKKTSSEAQRMET